MLAPATGALAAPGDEPPVPVNKVEICHSRDSQTNPYGPKRIEVAVDSIFGENGHASHTGPVFEPGMAHGWGDIIPPFWYQSGDSIQFYEGLNWPQGQEIWANDCQPTEPVEPTNPAVQLDIAQCTVPGGALPASGTLTLTGLIVGESYTVVLRDAANQTLSTETFDAQAAERVSALQLFGAGDYSLVVSAEGGGDPVVTDFTVQPCPEAPVTPLVSVVLEQCSAGGTLPASAQLDLSDLVVGDEYEIRVQGPDGSDAQQTVTADAAAMQLAVELHGVGAYLVTVTSSETGAEAQQGFDVKPCPEAPKGPSPKPDQLAKTGSADTQHAVLIAAIALLGGTALLFSRRSRRA